MILEHLPHLASKNITLASASPRRLQLLQLVGINPKVVTSTFEETLPKSDYKSAADYAVATSKGKALEVAEKLSDVNAPADLVIGADTGNTSKFEVHTFAETTAVHFSKLSEQEIAAYVATGECYGKAGAYGIQGAASVFVKSIQGDYFTVMGFPLNSFAVYVADLIRQKRL
ncbi:MAG: hypothetical protein FRX49_13544 [Trebouxia sp. A1-2]|nr:MAG: hypothetical protein FRX49_13544 [Trebouxia sp. A1-2]